MCETVGPGGDCQEEADKRLWGSAEGLWEKTSSVGASWVTDFHESQKMRGWSQAEPKHFMLHPLGTEERRGCNLWSGKMGQWQTLTRAWLNLSLRSPHPGFPDASLFSTAFPPPTLRNISSFCVPMICFTFGFAQQQRLLSQFLLRGPRAKKLHKSRAWAGSENARDFATKPHPPRLPEELCKWNQSECGWWETSEWKKPVQTETVELPTAVAWLPQSFFSYTLAFLSQRRHMLLFRSFSRACWLTLNSQTPVHSTPRAIICPVAICSCRYVWYVFIGDRWKVDFLHNMVQSLPWNLRSENLTH